jgi:hypothetical protein
MKRRPMIDEDGEVRELTREEIGSMRPIAEVLPEWYATMPWSKPSQRPSGDDQQGPEERKVKKEGSGA